MKEVRSSTIGSASFPSALQMASMDSSLQPPTKTERRRKKRCSSSKQVVAPLDRLAQGLLAGGHITCAAGQKGQTLPQTGQQELRREQPDARRCQLDGEWESIQANTDLCHSRGVGVRHLEIRLDCLRTFDKERHRFVL